MSSKPRRRSLERAQARVLAQLDDLSDLVAQADEALRQLEAVWTAGHSAQPEAGYLPEELCWFNSEPVEGD